MILSARFWQRMLMTFVLGFLVSDGALRVAHASPPLRHTLVVAAPALPLAYSPLPPRVTLRGRVIVVDLARQRLWAYQDGVVIFQTAVTTGRPGLATPPGIYQVQFKLTETWFTSAWPPGSPYYYAPELTHYALAFRAGGFYIHDASWRQSFGPGSNLPHTDPNGLQETGSHGCVEVTTQAAAWLYRWAPVGTEVVIEQGSFH